MFHVKLPMDFVDKINAYIDNTLIPLDDNYGKVKTNAIRLDTPLGYWARAKRRSLPQNKRLLRNRRLSRSLLRIPALPQLGGFSNDA